MTELILALVFVIPICALIVLFTVEAERMMREDAERHPPKEEPLETGGLTRQELRMVTMRAMRTDARIARMRAGYKRKEQNE